MTADLRQGNSRLAYAPAAQVLKALVAMFTVTAKDGPLNFTRPKKYTKNDRLITSLFEIAGKVLLLTGKPVSERVVQKALLLLHRDGLIYKTKGYYGKTQVCRLFIDLKGYRLHTKLEQAMYDCTKRYPTQTKRFPTAKEGEYGFARKMTLPYTPDGAEYINGSNPSVAIDREDTSSISLQNNPTNQISPLGTKNVPLARPLFSSKGPGEENEGSLTGDSQWVEFTLTPQVQKILEFIQSHGVFVDKTGQYHPLERVTAQEVATLVRAVEGGGLSLGFLKRYARMIGRQDADGWFMKTRLGFFCDHFFIIKKHYHPVYRIVD